jgi:hypothetical protein
MGAPGLRVKETPWTPKASRPRHPKTWILIPGRGMQEFRDGLSVGLLNDS